MSSKFLEISKKNNILACSEDIVDLLVMKLTLDHIQVTDLQDTGSYLDKQDPKVIINIGKVFLTTERKKDAGVTANFDDVLTADITEESYSNGVVFDIEVVNEGSFGGSKHVGRGTAPLKSLIADKNQHVSFVIPLTHFEKNGKSATGAQKGQVVVRGYLEAPKAAPVEPSPAAATPAPAKAPVAPVEATAAAAAEPAPAAAKPSTKTTSPASAAAAASEPEKAKPAPVSAPVKPEPAAAPIAPVAPQPATPTPSLPQPEYDDSKPLKLRLSHLAVRDLKDKGGAMDKQDPALRITVGDNKPFDTNRMKDAGVSADFPEIYELDIPASQFTNNLPIELEAFNVGGAPFHSRTSLGKVRVPLNSLVGAFNVEVPIAVDLLYPGKGGDVKQGQVLMRGTIIRARKGATGADAAPSGKETVKEKETAPVSSAAAAAPTGPTVTHHLFVSSITAHKLKNVELMMGDKNDPYVLLGFGSNQWSFKSEPQDGAGSEAVWRYVRGTPPGQKTRFPVTAEELQSAAFAVSVMDKNSFTADKLIGKGEARLANALLWTGGSASETKSGEVVVALLDASGAASGTVSLTIERETLVAGSPMPDSAAPAASVHIAAPAGAAPPSGTADTTQAEATEAELSLYKHTLFISKVAGKGLRNVEKMMFDKNDPYMVLKFGENTWSYTTIVLPEKGSDPVWEYDCRRDPQMKFTVSLQELRSAAGLLKVVAMDKNSITSDAFIGGGEVFVLSDAALNPRRAAEEKASAELVVALKDHAGKAAGTVTFTVERETVLKSKKPEAPASPSEEQTKGKTTDGKPFEMGELLVTRIVCQDLVNVEGWGGKNDPYVTLRLGAAEKKTEHIAEGGANVCFDCLNFSFDVDRAALDFEPINVTVTDRNTMNSDVLIGTASSSVKFTALRVGEELQLPLALKGAKGAETGKVILFLTLKHTELKTAVDSPLDPSFQSGLLLIDRIRAFDLQKPKSLLGGTHVGNPYVKMVFGSWQYKTNALHLASAGSPIFDNLDLSADVTAAMLESGKLAVEVYDKGMTGDTLVGKGECSMRTAAVVVGKEVQVEVDLINAGATAGKLVIFASAAQKKTKVRKEDVVVDEAFQQGYCSIKAITAHNLTNHEMMGKQDPYVILEFSATNWRERTVTMNEAGSDCHWKNLDLRCGGVTRAHMLAQDLTVTVMEDNATGDVLIGKAAVSLVESAAKGSLGKDVDICLDLVDGKGKPAGRVVLVCSMHPTAADLKIAPGLKEGVVKIKKIVAKGLETGNRISKNTPSIHFKYGAWEGVTGVGEGKEPVWEFLMLQSAPACSPEILATQPLTVSLLDNGKLIGSGTVDNLLLPGSQPDSDVDVSVVLLHSKAGTPVGKLTVTLNVGAPDVDLVALAAAEEEQAMPAYSDAVLLITSIKAEGLANTEWVGKSDPFVVLTLGAWSDQTVPCENAGGEVIWNDLKFREEFTADMLVHQPMDVAVYDKNNYSKNVLLGRGQASLKRVAYSMGKEVEVLVQLQGDKKGRSAGKVTLRAELREQSKALQKSLPADFVAGMLHVFRISAFNLPNKELVGKQDPFAVIKIGDFSDRTPTMSEAGSDPVFDLLDIKAKVSAALLQNQPLEIELWEDNTTGNVLLGTGKTTISKVTTVGEEVEFRVNLKDKKGENAGRALIFARLEEMPLTQEQEAVVPMAEGFTRGSICVRKICAFGLANTDLFPTKQDPYVMLQLGAWSDKTKVKSDAGTNSIWDLLSMEAEVDKDALQSALFEVKVMNSNNLRAHSEIGSGKVAIRRAAAKLKQLVELSVDLVNTKSGKPAGRVVLHVEVLPEELEESHVLPANFEFGHVQVSRIEAFNLKNMELIGLQDPFVVLKYGEWSDKTFTQDDAGSDAVWNFLTIGFDVNRAAIQAQVLEVAVWDENKGRAHALIGTGTVSLLKCAAHLAEQVEMKVKLLDPNGASAGKVSLFGTLTIPEPDAELPDTFSEGALKIKRVSVFGLKNSELFGLKKGDPFLKIRVNDFKAETKVLKSAGENPVWNNLDFLATVDVKTVRAGEVIVEAWEKNSGAFDDKLLASCEIPLRRAGGKLGHEVELIAKMKTSKGEERGEVNLLVQLDPVAALSLPDLGLPEKFSVGTVRITKIQALGLDNKEFMRAKQDPYICVSIGDWSETTSTLTSAGSNATWTALDMVAEVNADILGQEKMTVRVMDENTSRADSVLGVGAVSLRKLCPRINSAVELSVDLVADSGAAVGTVLVTAVLTESRLEDLSDALPESAVVVKRGQLVIKKITALDLKGGDTTFFGGKQDPYVLLTLENDWSAKTEEKKNAGRNAVWSDISDIEMPVTMDTLKYKRITVTVLDKNMFKSDSWMGKGDFSLRKLGSNGGAPVVVTHTVRLKDKRGRAAGKVLIDAEIQPLPDAALPTAGAAGASLQAPGMLSFLDCATSKVAESAVMGKQDLWVNLAVANWKHTTEVHKSAGTESSWPLKTSTTPLAMAQLAAQGLQVEVCARSMKGDTTLGKATLKLDKALSQPGKWVDLVTDLGNGQTSGASSVGKFRIKARYTEGAAAGDLSFPPLADQGMDDLKNSQNALNNRVGALEENIKAQLHKELLAERESILQAMAAQNKALSQSIEGLSRELAKERHAKASALDGLVINQVNAIKLPSDVKQWRSAHVQAWISFQMELPQYAEPFQKASIDGLVLIKHITRDTLQNSLEIVDPLHCQKILEGVQVLQNRQKEVDEAAEKERIKKLQKKKEEEDRKRAMMAELQKEAEARKRKEEKERNKDNKKKKKKKSATGNSAPKPYFGEVREQNVVDRARIERDMRTYRTERQKQADKADLASRTWKFEYTGAPQPKAETIWDSDPFSKTQGTSAYRKTMALDILGSQHFRASDDMPRAPSLTKLRSVPRNCAPEEVLALVKGAMYDVSNWLVEMEKIERRKSSVRDSDLGDANDDKVLSLLQQQEEQEYYYQQQRDYGDNWNEEEYAADSGALAVTSAPGVSRTRYAAEGSADDVPPAYEDLVHMSDEGEADDAPSDGEEGELPPPAYDDFIEAEVPPPAYEDFFLSKEDASKHTEPVQSSDRNYAPADLFYSSTSPPRSKLFSLVNSTAGDLRAPSTEPDRMSLIYQALIGQQNNNARWLGSNQKLTRMKLYGGFESLLRLKIDWPQFDALWTQLDSKRSGDIDLKEFKAFFGDLEDFKSLMGTKTLATTSKSKSIAALSKCLFELCDALRHAGFTVVEMFSGFDRNGSGDVSISEFCSMLRLVVGAAVEKRLIYQALSVLDTNGDKAISLEEVLRFVYRVWKSQLDELAEKLSRWDERMTGEQEKIRKAVEERRLIKEAIKKNFPREWRDRLEREGGHAIPGPFQALLQRMDVGETAQPAYMSTTMGRSGNLSAPTALSRLGDRSPDSPDLVASGPVTSVTEKSEAHNHSNLNLQSPLPATRSYRPSETWATGSPAPGQQRTTSDPSAHSALFTASAPLLPRGRLPANASAASAGVNEIMRFKIKVPAGCAPTRAGAELKVPAVRDLNSGTVNSAEVTEAVLRKFAPFEGYG